MIGKANATIDVTPYTVTYDGIARTATGTATGVGSPTPVDLSSLVNLSGTTLTNAGDYATDAWTFAGNGNYNAQSGTTHDVISKADAMIGVTPYTAVTYDGAAHTATGTATGVVSQTPWISAACWTWAARPTPTPGTMPTPGRSPATATTTHRAAQPMM